ncbi:MAG: glycosyltransferase [Sedimentisphaerales bacterium]
MPVYENIRLTRPHRRVTAITDRYDEYVIVHVGKIVGGFSKRFFMFVDVLGKRHPTYVKKPLLAFWHLMALHIRGRNACVIVYYDVLAPFIAIVRFLFPSLTLVYMVRGDQVSWARFQGRKVRAWVAYIFQKWMSRLGCMFVFASEDLRITFTERLGLLHRAEVLPNTVGYPLPPSRPFDGRIAVVGDFETVKNIEFVLNSLREGLYHVDLFGNTSLPEKWKRPWLQSHGVVADLPSHLKRCSLVVLSSVSEGFPNVVVEALEAGCCIVAPKGSPFRGLPLSSMWRYQMEPCNGHPKAGRNKKLTHVLHHLMAKQPDFRTDNRELYELIESDWEKRIWEIFE